MERARKEDPPLTHRTPLPQITFGGCTDINNGDSALQDTWVLDLLARTWFNVSFNGTVPPARFAHDAAVLPESRSMLVFGGLVPHGKVQNRCSDGALAAINATYSSESWLLRPSTELGDRSWERVDKGGRQPDGRAGHTLATTSKGVLLFGGVAPNADGLFARNESWLFSAANETWLLVNATPGHAPEARHSHSSVSMLMPSGPDKAAADDMVESVVVFGGTDNCQVPVVSGSHFYNDLWVFTVQTLSWYKVPPPNGTPPSPRYAHSSAVTGSNTLIVYGGAHSFGRGGRGWVVRRGGWRPGSLVATARWTGHGALLNVLFLIPLHSLPPHAQAPMAREPICVISTSTTPPTTPG